MVRTFIALELSKEIQDQLALAQETIRGCRARLTFVDPKNIHITAKFLGNVDDKTLLNVMDALRSFSFSSFPVTAGLVTVNNPKHPHTVWCAIDDAGQGERLFHLIEDVLVPLGFERETRRFTPHATLARVKSPHPSLFSALDSLKDTSYGRCTIPGIKLKKSTLLPQGPVYEDLLEVKW
jgi:RNA 2',3'-cyclic 3'-phosphodiesterase